MSIVLASAAACARREHVRARDAGGGPGWWTRITGGRHERVAGAARAAPTLPDTPTLRREVPALADDLPHRHPEAPWPAPHRTNAPGPKLLVVDQGEAREQRRPLVVMGSLQPAEAHLEGGRHMNATRPSGSPAGLASSRGPDPTRRNRRSRPPPVLMSACRMTAERQVFAPRGHPVRCLFPSKHSHGDRPPGSAYLIRRARRSSTAARCAATCLPRARLSRHARRLPQDRSGAIPAF